MKFIAVRINVDSREKNRYSEFPKKAEYNKIWKNAPQNGFHECVNFKNFRGKILGYMPPTGHMNIPEGLFGIIFVTPKTKTPIDQKDKIIGIQINCKFLGEYKNRNKNVPDDLASFLKRKNAELTYNYTAPFETSILLTNPIGNASEILIPSNGDRRKIWMRPAIKPISDKNLLKVLQIIERNLTKTENRQWKKMMKYLQTDLSLEYVEEKLEQEVNIALKKGDLHPKGNAHPHKVNVVTSTFIRDPEVVAAVLNRANGVCEFCRKKAPFFRKKNGTPYLEVHHKKQLKDGGADTVENALALCPNCHRMMHFGNPENCQMKSSDFSKIAVAVFNNSYCMDYEQQNEDLIDDIKDKLERNIANPNIFFVKRKKEDGSFSISRRPRQQVKRLKEKWNKVEYLVTFVFYDTDIHGEPPSIDDFQIYKVNKIDGRIHLNKMKEDFPFASLESDFFDKLNDDDFLNNLQDDAINILLLDEIMNC